MDFPKCPDEGAGASLNEPVRPAIESGQALTDLAGVTGIEEHERSSLKQAASPAENDLPRTQETVSQL